MPSDLVLILRSIRKGLYQVKECEVNLVPLPLQAKSGMWDSAGLMRDSTAWAGGGRHISQHGSPAPGTALVPCASSAPGQSPSWSPCVHGSIVFGSCLCARWCFLLFSHPRIKSVLNRPIDSEFVASWQKHFYIVEPGGVLLCRRPNCHRDYKKSPVISLLFIITKYIELFFFFF